VTLRGLAVVGTDTGVGKTAVSRGLLALARSRGLLVHPFKPVESGVVAGVPTDAELLREAAGTSLPAHFYRLAEPISPWLAAEREGLELPLPPMIERARDLSSRGAGVLVETAGGLLSPWSSRSNARDLLAELRLPVLLVAADQLGVQNHCLLTVEALRSRQIPLAGLILVGRPGIPSWQNEEALRRLFTSSYLGRLPHLDAPTTEGLAAALSQLDLGSLWVRFQA